MQGDKRGLQLPPREAAADSPRDKKKQKQQQPQKKDTAAAQQNLFLRAAPVVRGPKKPYVLGLMVADPSDNTDVSGTKSVSTPNTKNRCLLGLAS